MRKGQRHTQESKYKMSIAQKGKPSKRKGTTTGEETRKKMSDAHKNPTEETRKRISIAGKNRKPSKETKLKISNALKGRKLSEEHKHKMSLVNKGKVVSDETRRKQSVAKKGKPSKLPGRKHSIETRLKISDANKGEKSGLWRGGTSFEPYCPKFNRDLKQRIRAFFEYRCICCGKIEIETEQKLSCHHVEYDKKACCDGKLVHFATLCRKHHNKTNFDRERWECILHRTIDEIYDGKSYYTKEEYKELLHIEDRANR